MVKAQIYTNKICVEHAILRLEGITRISSSIELDMALATPLSQVTSLGCRLCAPVSRQVYRVSEPSKKISSIASFLRGNQRW